MTLSVNVYVDALLPLVPSDAIESHVRAWEEVLGRKCRYTACRHDVEKGMRVSSAAVAALGGLAWTGQLRQ